MSEPTSHPESPSVLIVGPDGTPLGAMPRTGPAGPPGPPGAAAGGSQPGGEGGSGDEQSVTDMIEQPAKVMRIGTMIKQLLEEVRTAPLDDASRVRLKEIHQTSIRELCEGLNPELREELNRLSLPFSEDTVPTDAELRIAQAQLVGWLEGLFHGIQTALFAQQMAARVQLEEMRRKALPGGMIGPGGPVPGGPRPTEPEPGGFGRTPGSGPYL